MLNAFEFVSVINCPDSCYIITFVYILYIVVTYIMYVDIYELKKINL